LELKAGFHVGKGDSKVNRLVGDPVRINPYMNVTGVIMKSKNEDMNMKFDYKVRLDIPEVSSDTVYFASHNDEEKYWWNYFNEEELDQLERNFEMVTR
jgi:hypothetical protein